MPRHFIPLENKGTLKVVFSLLERNKTTKQISDELNISQSSVSEQLNRLKRIGATVCAEKIGKNQYYLLQPKVIFDFLDAQEVSLQERVMTLYNDIIKIRDMRSKIKNESQTAKNIMGEVKQ